MAWLDGFARAQIKDWTGNPFTGGPYKIVLHTTEGSAGSGANVLKFYANRVSPLHPHFTIDMMTRQRWQHVNTTLASYSLRDASGGIRTNRDSVIAIEMVGYAADARKWSREQLIWLGEEVIAPIVRAHPAIVLAGPEFVPSGNNSYGLTAPQRMTQAAWDSFGGICGHQHVPENLHSDPGDIDMRTVYAAAEGSLGLVTDDRLINHPQTVSGARIMDWAVNQHQCTGKFYDYVNAVHGIDDPRHFGVDRTQMIAQAARETDFGRFGGAVKVEWNNFCGMKSARGHELSENNPDAWAHFASLRQCAIAHTHHLALYYGNPETPLSSTPDPRHFAAIKGTVTTVQGLSGTWAGDPNYGDAILRFIDEMVATLEPSGGLPPRPKDPEPPKPPDPPIEPEDPMPMPPEDYLRELGAWACRNGIT